MSNMVFVSLLEREKGHECLALWKVKFWISMAMHRAFAHCMRMRICYSHSIAQTSLFIQLGTHIFEKWADAPLHFTMSHF